MTLNEHKKELLSAYEDAQKIAFAPFIFQATAAAKETGLLDALGQNDTGLNIEELAQKSGLTLYAVKILTDILLTAKVIKKENQKYCLSLVGQCLIYDRMTEVNFDFTHHVNYKALSHTKEALKTGRPCGLQEFDPSWSTIYPHLKDLPKEVQKAWFAFDHFHSDSADQAAIDLLKNREIRYFLDIGGNTGRFIHKALLNWTKARACLVDLPQQISLMRANTELKAFQDRIDDYPIDWLNDEASLHIDTDIDLIWMSQFLDCFSHSQAVSILKRVRLLSRKYACPIAILEPIVDKQRNAAATLSVASCSLYFSCLANGNSKFFSSDELKSIIDEAGLIIDSVHEPLGVGHSLYLCR